VWSDETWQEHGIKWLTALGLLLVVVMTRKRINFIVYKEIAGLLQQSCAPLRRRRRHFADAAAADRNWSARRRRRRPNVGVAPAPCSWCVHVMFYTSYMLLDLISVMPFTTKLEHWQNTVRTMQACFAIAVDTQMKHGGVKEKVFSWTMLWKWYLMLNLVNKAGGTVNDFNSVYCNNCL